MAGQGKEPARRTASRGTAHPTGSKKAAPATPLAWAPEKTVVLTGAMRPAWFRDSDADFNLGFALGAASALPAGVYVAMHGRVFAAGRVRKNRGRFEEA